MLQEYTPGEAGIFLDDPFLDRLQQILQLERLRDVIVRPELHPEVAVVGTRACGEEYEWNMRSRDVLAQREEHAESVHLRHGDVADDEVRQQCNRRIHPDRPVLRREHFESSRLDQPRDIGAQLGLVFDHQDFCHYVTLCSRLSHRRWTLYLASGVPPPRCLRTTSSRSCTLNGLVR